MPTLHNIFPKTQDERIRDDVRRQLMWQTDIQSEEIVVEVKDSAVALSGRVETCLERQEAERTVHAVHGASSVTNSILVEPKCIRTDREITDDVIAGLRMAICVLEELPSVSVCDGVVTLRGRVRWKFQATAAERAGDAVAGVLGVRNLIEVAPLETSSPCRQINRKRLDDTPSPRSDGAPKPASSCRPLFFVPSVIGRA